MEQMAQAQILVAGANMLDDASVQAALAAGVSPKEITKSKCIYEVLAAACNAMSTRESRGGVPLHEFDPAARALRIMQMLVDAGVNTTSREMSKCLLQKPSSCGTDVWEKERDSLSALEYANLLHKAEKYSDIHRYKRPLMKAMAGIMIAGPQQPASNANAATVASTTTAALERQKHLLSSGLLADVLLQLRDNTIPAHKAILASASSVFAAMFQTQMVEQQTSTVEIDDCTNDAMGGFLAYVYHGGHEACTDLQLCVEMLMLADKYDVAGLKALCASQLSASLSVDTVTPILQAAHLVKVDSLKRVCIAFIKSNAAQLLFHQPFQQLQQATGDLWAEIGVELYAGGNGGGGGGGGTGAGSSGGDAGGDGTEPPQKKVRTGAGR